MLVAALRVKNESWVIQYTLSALSEFVDKIVIIDDGSTDDTIEICKRFAKVVCVHENGIRPENKVDEAKDWNRLTKLARDHGAKWILYTDADEMLEPKIVDYLPNLEKFEDVDLIRFRKVSPWKGISEFRTDHRRFDTPAEFSLNPIIARAHSKIHWHDGRGGVLKKLGKFVLRGEKLLPSLGRGFPYGISGKVLNENNILSVHFNHVSMDRLARKQVFYALVEKRMRPRRKRDDIVDWVSSGWSEDGMKLAPMKPNWFWAEYLPLVDLSDAKQRVSS